MNAFVITPRDPLLFRDGRPFSSDPGARAKSLDFPLPSTLIGAIRSYAGSSAEGLWQPERLQTVLEYAMRGPLLCKNPSEPRLEQLFLPAPLDALMFDAKKIRALQPLQIDPDEHINLNYAPVGLAHLDPQDKSKPDGMPKFWRWQALMAWLEQAKDFETTPSALGFAGLKRDTRVHVSLDAATQTAQDGALFATSALEFVHTEAHLSEAQTYGLYAELSGWQASAGLIPLGGEGRFAALEPSQALLPQMLECETGKKIHQAILERRACRVVLLTPAYFRHGWLPEYLLEPRFGVTPKLVAAALGKAQTISGWDYARLSPKPTRRLVPAGSVYYLRLEGEQEALAHWLQQLWLANISDEDPATQQSSAFRARKDGFGLCALGAWSGELQALEVKS